MNKNTVIALAISTSSALLIMAIIALFSVMHMRNDMNAHARSILSIIEDIDADAQHIWSQVTALAVTPCGDDHLALLRTLLKQAFHIKDISYVENNRVLCSVVHGDRFATAAELTPHDYVTPAKGAKIWASSFWPQFDNRYRASLVLREKHLLVVTDEAIKRFAYTPYRWNLQFGDSLDLTNLRGDSRLVGPWPKFSWIMGDHQIKQCLSKLPYCVNVRHAGWQYASENRLLTILTILVGHLCGWLIYTTTKRCLCARTQPLKRITLGLKEGSFYPLFQPIVDLSNGQIIGVEALARFKDAYGELPPDTFIPLIAKINKTWEFTETMINQSIELLRTGNFDKSFSISFNFYPKDIAQGSAVAVKRLPSYKSWHGKFRVEITEDQALDKAEAHRHLQSIANSGIEIAIDDFGTGYSNLHAIDQLHCNYLKIDRSFITDMEQGAVRASLIPHIIEIAKQANLQLIAEGIENLAQAELLKDMGVQFGQGYYFGKPMPVAGIVSLINNH